MKIRNGIRKIKKVCLSVITCMSAGFLLGVSAYPALQASADVLEVKENVAVIGTAGAESVLDVSNYKVEITVNKNSTINVSENVTVAFLEDGATNFYRKIFKDVDQLTSVSVFCEGNEEFSYGVIAGQDETTIECYGGVECGAVWTYEFNYTIKADETELGNELVFNIIGEGWPETVENVEADISLPDAILSYGAYSGDGENASNVTASVSDDGKSLKVSSKNREAVASSAITVKIQLPSEALVQDFNETMELAQQSEVMLLLSVLPYILIAVAILVFGILAIAV